MTTRDAAFNLVSPFATPCWRLKEKSAGRAGSVADVRPSVFSAHEGVDFSNQSQNNLVYATAPWAHSVERVASNTTDTGDLREGLDAYHISPMTEATPTSRAGVGGAASEIGAREPLVTRILDVAQHLEPPVLGSDDHLGDTSSRETQFIGAGDPVFFQFLSLIEAADLLLTFCTRLNPMIALFDPNVHTLTVLRESPFLFTAILTVTAKFTRKDLYRPLLSHADLLLNRALFSGQCSIPVIKALIILVFWKDPRDKTAWLRIGIALRLSYQLGLHVPRTSPLPDDDILAQSSETEKGPGSTFRNVRPPCHGKRDTVSERQNVAK
ncbi:hypothetical protein IAT40_004210 [Kwoniella sp. CBS 6097]